MDAETKLQRMSLCFETRAALADFVRLEPGTVNQILADGFEVPSGSHVENKIERGYEQLQKEHQAGIEAVSYALQTIERVRAGTLTDEQLDNVETVLQKKADDCNTAWA